MTVWRESAAIAGLGQHPVGKELGDLDVDIEGAVRLVVGDAVPAALRAAIDAPFERHVSAGGERGEVLEHDHTGLLCKGRFRD
jgi:hypothetical protein